MSGRLFRLGQGSVTELRHSRFTIERDLQRLLEAHLQTFLGVRFLASEYSTGARHGGRIDTLGLDENGLPVIIEYKREVHESVINQGLYYLDWLLNSRAEFQLLVQQKLGAAVADEINWTAPRLICIAGDFTRYDKHAVQQINRNIELVRYLRYGDDLIMLELANTPNNVTTGSLNAASVQTTVSTAQPASTTATTAAPVETVEATLRRCSPSVQSLFGSLDAYVRSMDDQNVQMKALKLYFAYKKLRNFATVVPGTSSNELWLYLHLDPSTVDVDPAFMRDVTSIGHWGTGNLEITLRNENDLEQVKPLIQRAFELGA